VKLVAASAGKPRTTSLDDVLAAAMRLDPTALRRALDAAAESLGVDAAIDDVALPAMHEIGSRWTAGICDVAQEHLATDGVRTWLARLSAMAPSPHRGATLVLACGPKDLHSIGLEAFGVLLARAGWDIRVLGPLTPADAIVSAVAATGATGVVITSQRSVTRRAAAEAIATVAALPRVTVFYAGDAFASASARRVIPGVYLGTDLPGAVTMVQRALSPSGRERRSA